MSLKITPVDGAKEKEGVWTKYLNVELKVARSTNSKYVNEISKNTRRFSRKKKASNEEMLEALSLAASKYLLVDWKNFLVGEENIPYSEENAYDLIRSDGDCREFILDFADDIDNYYINEAKETAGK